MKKQKFVKSQSLKGIKVLDFAEVWAGPYGASLLGDLGADVIKIESFPRRSLTRPLVEDARVADGPGPAYERTTSQIQGNRNKRNIALNVKHKEGELILQKLIEKSDIIIEGFAAGVIEKLGFSWKKIHAINKNISVISMPAWGVKGPYAGYVALGSGIEASVGHALIRGVSAKNTVDIPGNFITDATAPIQVVIASLVALNKRKLTKKGSFIDLSQAEAFAWHLVGPLGEWTLNNREAQQLGNSDRHIVPHNCYLTLDSKWVAIAAENDEQWQGLCNALDEPKWGLIENAWGTITGRLKYRKEIDSQLKEICSKMNSDKLVDIIQKNGAIASPVVDAPGMFSNLQMHERNWFKAINLPYLGERLMPGFLWNMEPDSPIYEFRTEQVGEHNEEILKELGYDTQSIETFYEESVIGDHYVE
ncbi:MAG: CoA transferase [Dehalococcoidia bacterium]|jgi:crotonobetainyl-CoA:carnitine CoA-transferase CaiB-like acyl-CoA transferase|nr:CoA transferase [Dehalococcoidia bacterium]